MEWKWHLCVVVQASTTSTIVLTVGVGIAGDHMLYIVPISQTSHMYALLTYCLYMAHDMPPHQLINNIRSTICSWPTWHIPTRLAVHCYIAGRVLAGGLKLELTTHISGYALSVCHPSVELATKPADAADSCLHPPYFVSICLYLHYYPTGKTKYVRKSVM